MRFGPFSFAPVTGELHRGEVRGKLQAQPAKVLAALTRQDVQQIARDLDAQWVLIGQLKSDGQKQRVIAHLIRAADMKHLWAQTLDDDAFDLAGQSRAGEATAAAVTASLTTTRK